MGSTSKILETCSGADEEESFLFAMQLASASVLPMVLKSAVELDLLELIKKAGPGAFVSPADLSAQLPTTNPEARVMLDRILRLLTTYSVLNCRLKTLPDGGVERLYGLAPVCRFLTKNEDGVSMAPLLLMNQDKVLMESWVSTVRGKEFWCERRHSCRDGRSLQICPTPTLRRTSASNQKVIMDGDSMSMGSNGSIGPSRCKRRVWSKAEEKLLVIALKEIISEGWKCENGFRSGYLVYLEKKLRKQLPCTDLKAEPHISSKIHTWKKIQGSLNAMLSRSGFSWSHEAMKLNVEDEDIWNEYIRVDKFAKRLRNRSFTMLDDWNEIFGKDRATGAQAEDLNGADAATQQGADTENGTEDGNDVGSDAEEITSPGRKLPTPNADLCSKGRNSSASKKKRKLNIDDTGEAMVNLMGKFCEQTNERLAEIASKVGYEFAMSSKREKLFEAVSSLCVLSPEDVISVTRKLANNNKDLDLFFALPEVERGRMVLCLAAGEP